MVGKKELPAQKKKELTVKLMRYVMLLLLFSASYLLPGYGLKKQADKQASARGRQEDNRETIVVDPGHGGFDSGMVSAEGTKEKDLNLIFAKKLGERLEKAGYRVVYTRESDRELCEENAPHKKAQDMMRRVELITQASPILTISIHQNSYPEDSSVQGPQVFYFEHSIDGEKLAKSIQQSLNTELEVVRPRTEKGNTSYYILKRSKGVTVIVECGFLTNPEEKQKLQQEAYQDKMTEAIFNGIAEYCKQSEAG